MRGSAGEPSTAFGKLLIVAMSFFILTTNAMYTANLATQQVLDAQQINRYGGLEEVSSQPAGTASHSQSQPPNSIVLSHQMATLQVIANGKKVCMPRGTAYGDFLLIDYPSLSPVYVDNGES